MAVKPPHRKPKTTKHVKHAASGGVLNPPFDHRMTNIGTPSMQASKLTRGWVVNADTGARVNFLFNPQAIQVTHPIQVDRLPLGGKYNNPDFVGSPEGQFIGDVEFSLLFDRTYEMWDNSNSSMAHEWGIYADILAFYQLLGINTFSKTSSHQASLISIPVKKQQSMAALYPVSFATVQNAWVYFGNKMRYYGWITNFSITYSHWSRTMIPLRGGVDISFTLIPNAKQKQGARVTKTKTTKQHVPGAKGKSSTAPGRKKATSSIPGTIKGSK